MSSSTTRLTLEITPSSRIDVIDVSRAIEREFGDALAAYPRALYCSYHTTAGYFDEPLCDELGHQPDSLQAFLGAFQEIFPPGANYRHDQLHLRTELSAEQRECEPRNADSHLKFIGSGLENCVTYRNRRSRPVYFIDLDGVNEEMPRRRRSTVIGYHEAEIVDVVEMDVPVSGHAVDSISLKDERLGVFARLQEHALRYGVEKGWVEIELAPEEQHTGLTVNEYETLLMKYDLLEVLKDPLRFMAEKGRNMLRDPRAIPNKAKNYAKYDLVHVINEAMDRLRLSDSLLERAIDKLVGYPAAHFLRMKRSVRLLISDQDANGVGPIVHGTYQSPILVQWRKANGGRRRIRATIKRCL